MQPHPGKFDVCIMLCVGEHCCHNFLSDVMRYIKQLDVFDVDLSWLCNGALCMFICDTRLAVIIRLFCVST